MRKNIGRKSWFYPLPIHVVGTYNEDGTPNAINALYGTLCRSDMIELSISHNGSAFQNILEKKAFTVNFADAKNADVSKADEHKRLPKKEKEKTSSGEMNASDQVRKRNWTAIQSKFVDAPAFEEFPVTWECVLKQVTENGNIIGTLKNISANEDVLDEKGIVSTEKFKKCGICFER